MTIPAGNLVTLVGFDPTGKVIPLQVDANGFIRSVAEPSGAGVGTMLTPSGKLVTPVGFDPTGKVLPVQVNASGYLRIVLESGGGIASYTAILSCNALSGTVAAGATRWIAPGVSGVTTVTTATYTIPLDGVISNFGVTTQTNQPAGNNLGVTLYVNGLATAVGPLILAGSVPNTYYDTLHTLAISKNDQLNIQIHNFAGAASAQISTIQMQLNGLTTP